jgi:hypothetical protein
VVAVLETPGAFGQAAYGGEDLARFQWHTGAPLRPLAADEPCPILFRDLGPEALARFLRGTLPRLAGPLTPLTYLRTAAFREPYTDHESTGRVIVLRPLSLRPWHSGVPGVFVARAAPGIDDTLVGYVPGALDLTAVGRRAAAMRSTAELREELGGPIYDGQVRESLASLDRLGAELAASERAAAPLRRRLQSRDAGERRRAREGMAAAGITEDDLCAAYHHLPRERRAALHDALARLAVPS